MADLPGEGYVYRYSGLLKKLLSAKGGEPISELSPELVAAIILENDRFEQRALGSVISWGSGSLLQAAGVGLNSHIGIRNPAGSGTIVVIEMFLVLSPIAGQVIDFRQSTTLVAAPTLGTTTPRDTRLSGSPSTQALLKNNATLLGGLVFPFVSNAAPLPFFIQHALGPGTEVYLSPETQNLAIQGAFVGYERAAEASELAFNP